MCERKGKKEEHTITRKHKVKLQYITNSNKYEFSKFIYKERALQIRKHYSCLPEIFIE